MTETSENATVNKGLALAKAREIYLRICNFSPDIKTNPMQTVYDIGTHLETATGSRQSLRFLDPQWIDSDNAEINSNKEMEWYFKVSFTSNYSDKVNSLKRQIDTISQSPFDAGAGLGERITDLQKAYTKAAAPQGTGTLMLDVPKLTHEVTAQQKQLLITEARHYNAETQRINSLEQPSQKDIILRNDYNYRLRNLKTLLGDEMPEHKVQQLAGVQGIAQSLNFGLALNEAANVEIPLPAGQGVVLLER